MKKILKTFFALAVVLSLMACSAEPSSKDNSLKAVLDKGELVIGFTDYPPMGFMVDGEATGFDLDIAKEVADRLGVKAVFQYIDWDAKVLELDSKAIDVIWNGLTITAEREQEILFSKPYFDNRIVILTTIDSKVDAIADLAGLNVGVELQSSGQSSLEDNPVYASLNEMIKFTSISEALMALNANTIDAIVADEIFARYAISKDASNYRIATEVFGSENYGIGFRLEDVALRDRVDEIIDELASEGIGSEISVKWFGEDLLKR